MSYELIAFDMDGTLLDSHKRILQGSQDAIAKAVDHGKIVILNTGRSPAELEEYFDVLDGVQYLNCISGAYVYDRKNQREIYTKTLDIPIIQQLLEVSQKEDTMVQLLTKESIVQRDKIPQMNHYHMSVYQSMYERVTTKMDHLYQEYNNDPFEVAKVNIYHTSKEARERTKQRIRELNLQVEFVDAEKTSVEISALNVHKGIGLKKLCEYLDIPLSQTIVVGDADNDIEALKIAGLAVAMGNGKESVKKLADVIVSGHDEDGCQEVIEKYLLD